MKTPQDFAADEKKARSEEIKLELESALDQAEREGKVSSQGGSVEYKTNHPVEFWEVMAYFQKHNWLVRSFTKKDERHYSIRIEPKEE